MTGRLAPALPRPLSISQRCLISKLIFQLAPPCQRRSGLMASPRRGLIRAPRGGATVSPRGGIQSQPQTSGGATAPSPMSTQGTRRRFRSPAKTTATALPRPRAWRPRLSAPESQTRATPSLSCGIACRVQTRIGLSSSITPRPPLRTCPGDLRQTESPGLEPPQTFTEAFFQSLSAGKRDDDPLELCPCPLLTSPSVGSSVSAS